MTAFNDLTKITSQKTVILTANVQVILEKYLTNTLQNRATTVN